VNPADRPMRADARRNYERILIAARKAFSERGEQASMDDIAKRAEVGPGTLYRHFPNREALLAAVYRDDVGVMAKRAVELADKLPPFEALAAWLHEQLEYIKAKLGINAVLKSMLKDDTETFEWCRDTMRDAVGGLLKSAQEAGAIRPDVDHITVLRLAHGVGMASENAPEMADRMLDLVIDGLRAKPAPPAA
jgi:AcrR family transcriptional regulator